MQNVFRALFLSLMVFGLIACQADRGSEPVTTGDGPTKLVKGKRDGRFDGLSVVLRIKMPSGQSQLCSGTMIEPQLLLTAAHCVEDLAKALKGQEIQVETMQNKVNIAGGAEAAGELKTIGYGRRFEIHPSYADDPRSFDIALVMIERLPDDKHVAVVTYPEMIDEKWLPAKTDNLILTGAGVKSGVLEQFDGVPLSEAAPFEGELQVERAGYFQIIYDLLGNSQLSAGDLLNLSAQESAAWLCAGDSGGGFFLEKDGKFYLAAVNSRARTFKYQGLTLCLTSGMIVTPLSPYRAWITAVAKSFTR